MDIYPTDEIYIVNAHTLTLSICIVNNVIKPSKHMIGHIEVTNDRSRTERIYFGPDFNPSLKDIESFFFGDTQSGVFSFTKKEIAEKALVILVKKELKEEERRLEEYKTLFHKTFDNVIRLQNQYDSLTKTVTQK